MLRTGNRYGEWDFGRQVDARGIGLLGDQSGCVAADFNSMLARPGGAWFVTHFECIPGILYLSEVAQRADGGLTAVSTRPIDTSDVGGGWIHCAGQVTPWGSHLASEESEPEARGFEPGGYLYKRWARMHRYYGGDSTVARPYHFGWMTEVSVSAEGTPTVGKHYAMGRFSHEIGHVMPDRRTVYLTDDARGFGAFFLFVADRADDLSAGHLYAMRWDQETAADGGRARLSWVPLGHATDTEVRASVDADPMFSDLLTVHPLVGEDCPAGSVWTRTAGSDEPECLSVVPGQERAASRLEARRVAAMKGATTELTKSEGLAWDPDAAKLYMVLSAVVGSALDEGRSPEREHVRLAPNPCGGVYGMDVAGGQADTSGAPIDSAFVATAIAAVVQGRSTGDACDPEGISNPDNIAYLPGHRALMIAEDTRGHDVAMLWHHDMVSGALTRVHTAPANSEVTGLAWVPDLGGHGYLSVTHQTNGERPSGVGYLGPFPVLTR